MRWEPGLYEQFASHRSRPFFDLVAQIHALEPRNVVDLGCGPGTLTSVLSDLWPSAEVLGIDSSAEMVDRAEPSERLRFELGDVREWSGSADVVVSNATLQWLPDHHDLLRHWAAALPSDGWIAFQVPSNFSSPAYVSLTELARDWGMDGSVLSADAVAEPAEYGQLLAQCGLDADVWETTYQQLLPGPDAVLAWLRGTSMRGLLSRLSDEDGERFCTELTPRLRAAYPEGTSGTRFAFRRVFAVGHRVDS